jgi:acetyl esterase
LARLIRGIMSRMHLDVPALREQSRARAADRPRGPELPVVDDVIVPDTPGVRARHYRPDAAARRPLLVYLHGGFWVLGNLETHDRLCRRIAAEAGIEVLAVAYRLAPEHPWPAAVDDALAAVRWASAWLAGGAPVAIGGDSAGGCVAALAALALRDEGAGLLHAQVLLCPDTDLTGAQPSMEAKGSGFGLEADAVRAAAALWVPAHARRASGAVSPLHAGSLAGLPPTLLITAEDDPLGDEGRAYARRLEEAGVAVTARCEPGLRHGFFQDQDAGPAAEAATARLLGDVRALLRG